MQGPSSVMSQKYGENIASSDVGQPGTENVWEEYVKLQLHEIRTPDS